MGARGGAGNPVDTVFRLRAARQIGLGGSHNVGGRVLLGVLVLVTLARAEIMVADSLEWLVVSSPTVAVMRVEGAVRENRDDVGYIQTTLKLGLVKALKGQPPPTTTYGILVLDSARPGELNSQPQEGEDLLAFWRGHSVRRVLSLKHPPSRGEQAAYTSSFKLLRSREEILAAVQPWLTRPALKSRKVEVPTGSGAFQGLYSGSTCYLIVPDE
ncbi:MAG: hypothetical protein AMXMBFR33_56850 [Candidatus Xenobia bacterium]